MKYNERAAAAKRQVIQQAAAIARHTNLDLSDETVSRAVAAFSQVTPPEEPEEPEVTIGLITIGSPYSAPKAQSRKPGNVVLNWRKLIDIVPDVSLAGLGAATLPLPPVWSVVLAGLYVWNKIWKGSVEEFSDIEATAILALWKNRNGKDKIAEDDGFKRINELRATYSLPPLTRGQFTSVIDRFVQIDCIELDDGTIWLREWVRVKYS